MDTRLKKFNSTLILKIVAFALCITCVLNCTSQAISVYNKVEDYNIRQHTMKDVVDSWINNAKPIQHTDTFKRHMTNYMGLVATMTGRFGNGTEKDYEMWKNSISASNEAFYKEAKENLKNHIIADDFMLYLALVSSGVVTPLGMLTTAEYSGNTRNIYINQIEDYNISYNYLCNDPAEGLVKHTLTDELKKKADKLGADGVFELNNYYQIYDFGYDEETIIESYKPSYYAFKINDSVLKEKLIDHDVFVSDHYGSAGSFVAAYKRYAESANQNYPSGRYFIRDNSGRVYTNMDKLGAKSTEKEIEAAFGRLGFWCYDESGSGDFCLVDGSYYNYSVAFGSDMVRYDEDGYDFVVTTLMMPTEPARMETTVINGEEVTVPVTESTTQKAAVQVDTNDSTPFVDEAGGNSWICIFGVDMYGENYPDTDLFRTAGTQIAIAGVLAEDIFRTAGILGTLFLVCFIYLIARAGRRRGDTEMHLLKTDAMFVDLRIAIDCLAGFGLFMLFVLAVDSFENYELRAFNIIVSVLVAAFAAVVIDLVLFITRQIKARTLFKRISIVWLLRKSFGFYKNKISPVLSEKLLYTKEFSKGTLIRVGIVVAVNIVLGFYAVLEAYNNDTCFILLMLALLDIALLVWVVRFIGGLHKIFTALEQIRQGNYDVYINIYALPSTLRENAQKVMSLRDGLKNAVDEAVKQEQTKTELITNVSHDLKTPLTSIINYVELLKKCNINDADAKEYLDILGEKSDRLKKLIEDLVEASKASTGNIKVEFVEVSLNEMVSQLLGEHADVLEKRRLNVISEMPVENLTVRADGKLLYRVMENLIVNVEKYSLYGTRVYVTVKEENGYGTVTFKNISEQPLNITAEQLKERFVRGDESRSTEGNGLGLSIAQSLCDVQGGELEIVINGDLFTAKVRLKK